MALTITGSPVAVAQVGVLYPGFYVSAQGGVAPYTFSFPMAGLPSGLDLQSVGPSRAYVGGVIRQVGQYGGCAIRVRDATGAEADLQLGTITATLTAPIAGPVVVHPEAGFVFTDYPFTILRQGTGVASIFTTTYDYEATKTLTPDLTAYAGPGGSDANNGLTFATRKRSLSAAKALAETATTCGRVLAAGGEYRLSAGHSFLGVNVSKPMIIESYDGLPVRSIRDVTMPTWVQHGATNYWKSTYTTETPAVLSFDMSNLDSDGDPTPLAAVLTAVSPTDPTPELDAQFVAYPGFGCSYRDTVNKVYWARTFDNRQPDSNLIVTDDQQITQVQIFSSVQRRLWLSDISLLGGRYTLYIGGTGTPEHLINTQRCAFLGARGEGGLRSEDVPARVTSYRSRAKYNYTDGFSYSKGRHVQIETKADWNAWNLNTTSNATTLHVDGALISVNCLDIRAGRVIAHVDSAMHWMLSGAFGMSRLVASSYALYIGGVGNPVKMWVDATTIVPGSTSGAFVGAPAEFYYSSLTGALPSGDGVIAPYTPAS